MKKILFFILTLSVTTAQAQKVVSMNWMIGTWKIDTGKGLIVEKWKPLNDSTLVGRSLFVKAPGDSALQENMELSLRGGRWTFSSAVQGQNNNQAIAFAVVFARGTEFISENPAHDFPQRIAYRRIKNSLFASIEGRKNGKFGKQNFDYILE